VGRSETRAEVSFFSSTPSDADTAADALSSPHPLALTSKRRMFSSLIHPMRRSDRALSSLKVERERQEDRNAL